METTTWFIILAFVLGIRIGVSIGEWACKNEIAPQGQKEE